MPNDYIDSDYIDQVKQAGNAPSDVGSLTGNAKYLDLFETLPPIRTRPDWRSTSRPCAS